MTDEEIAEKISEVLEQAINRNNEQQENDSGFKSEE